VGPLMPHGKHRVWDVAKAHTVDLRLLHDSAPVFSAADDLLLLITSIKAINQAGQVADDVGTVITDLDFGRGPGTWNKGGGRS
jgi:hypothetical protein